MRWPRLAETGRYGIELPAPPGGISASRFPGSLLAASMLIPMLTLAPSSASMISTPSSGRACSPRLPASRWSCRDGRGSCISSLETYFLTTASWVVVCAFAALADGDGLAAISVLMRFETMSGEMPSPAPPCSAAGPDVAGHPHLAPVRCTGSAASVSRSARDPAAAAWSAVVAPVPDRHPPTGARRVMPRSATAAKYILKLSTSRLRCWACCASGGRGMTLRGVQPFDGRHLHGRLLHLTLPRASGCNLACTPGRRVVHDPRQPAVHSSMSRPCAAIAWPAQGPPGAWPTSSPAVIWSSWLLASAESRLRLVDALRLVAVMTSKVTIATVSP